MAGLMLWPADAAHDVGRVYRDLAFDAPDELGSGLVMLTGPPEPFVPEHLQGSTVVGLAILWSGDEAAGHDVVQPWRDLSPEIDLVGPMPYAAFNGMLDDPPGNQNYWTADYHDDFPDDALDVFVKYGSDRASPLTQQLLLPWGGAVARVAEGATPMTNRSVRWITHPFAVWADPADTDANIAWARNFRRDIAEVHERRRLPQLHRERGPGPRARRVRRRQLPAARAGQGRVGPEERVPRQPEHRTG